MAILRRSQNTPTLCRQTQHRADRGRSPRRGYLRKAWKRLGRSSTATENDVFLTVNTAGKAMGVAGAFVAGPAWAIDYLIQRARPFIFSTAPPPSLAAALSASLTVIQSRAGKTGTPPGRTPLCSAACWLESGLDIGRSMFPDHSRPPRRQRTGVFRRCGTSARRLRRSRAPTADGSTRYRDGLRISVNSHLDESTLRRFASARGTLTGRIEGSDSLRKVFLDAMLSGLFITGTDTNVGKTVVAAALMHRYRHPGALAILEADSNRNRAGRRHRRSGISAPAVITSCFTQESVCLVLFRRTWPPS